MPTNVQQVSFVNSGLLGFDRIEYFLAHTHTRLSSILSTSTHGTLPSCGAQGNPNSCRHNSTTRLGGICGGVVLFFFFVRFNFIVIKESWNVCIHTSRGTTLNGSCRPPQSVPPLVQGLLDNTCSQDTASTSETSCGEFNRFPGTRVLFFLFFVFTSRVCHRLSAPMLCTNPAAL